MSNEKEARKRARPKKETPEKREAPRGHPFI